MSVYAVIMAGGSGTRFWPLSRADRPKQLLALGPSPRSLLAETCVRIAPVAPAERVYVVTTERLVDGVRAELPLVPPPQILAEPVGRNTAPCIGWAASLIAERDPDAILVVLPADHHVADVDGFVAVLQKAIEAASAGALVTCGLEPTRPETGYGYVEVGEAITAGVHRSVRFVEKPDRARAEAFVAGGRHLWNSGLFVFRAQSLLDAIEAHLPDLHRGLGELARGRASGDERATLRAVYPALPSISIDHGVMEKAPEVLVVPGAFGWSDLGSFETAFELGEKTAEGNVVHADLVSVDSTRNYVHAPAGKRIALLGVEDLVVVDTGDVLLVMPRARSQDVRAVVSELERIGDPRR